LAPIVPPPESEFGARDTARNGARMTGRRGSLSNARRVTALLEVTLFGASIVVFIWWLEPLQQQQLEVGFYTYILVFAFGSPIVHRNSLRQLGIRFDTLGACVRQVTPATIVATGIFFGVNWAIGAGTVPDLSHAIAALARYVGWALVQQYALQCVVLLRLKDAGLGSRAPVAGAILFALMHLPNPGLTLLTFAGGWVWCRTFDRAPSLLPLAVSHAITALAANLWLPDAFVGGLRVGPGYFRH
jgi:hypothetical protein